MKRVLVIGSGGAGKTTLATRLGRILKLEVIHLDSLYWHPGWIETPAEEWSREVERLVSRDSWIIDGNYSATLEPRLEACDTVVFLDLARLTCLYRVIKRSFEYRNKPRPDMAEGCPEKISLDFVLWIWNYKRRTRPKIVNLLRENEQNKKVIWLRSDSDAEDFLAGLEQA